MWAIPISMDLPWTVVGNHHVYTEEFKQGMREKLAHIESVTTRWAGAPARARCRRRFLTPFCAAQEP